MTLVKIPYKRSLWPLLVAWILSTGCGLELLGPVGLGDSQDGDPDASTPYLDLGTLPPVVTWHFSPAETHKISENNVSDTPINGTCRNGATVYALDSSSLEVLGSAPCTLGQFTISIDFSDYSDGNVPIKLTQVQDEDSSSAYQNITLVKETSFCANPSNKGAMPSGLGTAISPFLICTAEQLSNTFDAPNGAAHFHLKNNIDASSEPSLKGRFVSGVHEFTGTLNGNYFAILNYSGDEALIDRVSPGGVIQDLKLRTFNVTFAIASQAAVLVRHFNGTTFTRVSATGILTMPDMNSFNESGILVGTSNESISNCWVDAQITIASQTMTHFFGMITGALDGGSALSNSWVKGSITGASGSNFIAGALIGRAKNHWDAGVHSVANTYAEVNIQGGKYSGGLVGENSSSSQLEISASGFKGNVTAASNAGGLVGNGGITPVVVSDSYAQGTISQTGTCAGGLMGSAPDSSSVTRSFFKGRVATTDVSGFSGIGGISGCTASNFIMDDSHAVAGITGSGNDAGLLGGTAATNAKLTSSYFMGTVSNGGDALIVDATPLISNVYYNVDMASSAHGVGLSDDQFSIMAEFVGFSFGTVWVMGNTRPKLSFEP